MLKRKCIELSWLLCISIGGKYFIHVQTAASKVFEVTE